MRIGLSILTSARHNIWSNGIGQNVYHLACLLERLPRVEQVVLINTGDQDAPPPDAGDMGARFAMLSPREAMAACDLAIEMSGALDLAWLGQFRAQGGKAVFLNCGQPYLDLVEPGVFHRNDYFPPVGRCDEIWLLPKDRAFAAMMRSLYRCPVREVPYLWSPVFLERKLADLAARGITYGYREGMLAHGLRPAIFEPNISPGKMGTIPFLICETLEKLAPGSIGQLSFLNTSHMLDRAAFVALVGSSHLHRAGKVALAGRQFVGNVLGEMANLAVCHQIDWSQNYLYLDVLYGNYPLIHNAPPFADVGYAYDGNDIASGVAALRRAFAEHDRDLAGHEARGRRLMASLSPADEANQQAYARRLSQLMGAEPEA
ncbi:MAG: DUF2827 family protein [Sphingomonadales bacterium]|nr:DUF2827 family protein [Sphingomonadales bacterium]MDE2167924.1 DUF2827 family protein [Sphingomonadales bacterium]